MLYDAKGFDAIYIQPGYTDMRKSIDGFKLLIGRDLGLNPYEKNILFLFCGKDSSKIKGLVWEGDGFLLLYKRIEDGRYIWPRNAGEVMNITQEQFDRLMQGFAIEGTIREISPKRIF